MRSVLGILIIGGLLALSLGKITIDSNTRTFRDEHGRARLFHGTNVVVKGPPYLPVQDRFDPHMSLSDVDIQNMIDWGIHFVRLGVMWESVESSFQVYNMTYLAEVDKLITKLGEKGIYTLVDAHQDLFSRQTCGEGMPTFYISNLDNKCSSSIPGFLFNLFGQCKAIADYGFRVDDQGRPLIEDCVKTTFTKYYTSPEVCSSFELLYTNDTVQQGFISYWDVTSKALGGNVYVIGFDPINEPWPANFYKDFSLFYKQSKFDNELLYPLLQKIHTVIRKNVPEMNYFYEPAQFPDTFPMMGGIVASLAFPDTPGGVEYLDKQVLNDHTYCCQADANMCATGEPLLEKKDTCKAFHQQKVKVRAEDAKRYGVPLIFSEFGACANTESCFYEITSAAEEFDNHLASWSYWMFKGFGDFTTTGSLTEGMYDSEGNLQIYKQLALQRTFIHAFQGTQESLKFINYGDQNGTFVGQYTLDTDIDAATEIFFNEEVYYKNGYKLSVLIGTATPQSLVIDSSQKNYLKLKISDDQYDGKTVSILLTPVVNTTQASVQSNGVQLSYTLEEQSEEKKGFITFKVSGVQTLGSKYSFEILSSDDKLICQGTSSEQSCQAYNFLGHSVKINIITPGWFTKNYELQTSIHKLNGQIVNISLSKVTKELF